jgi:phosphoribosylformylglycinamidine synthase
VIGMVGLLPVAAPVTVDFKRPGSTVLLLGGLGTCSSERFGGTQYAKVIVQKLWGLPPALDLEYEKRVQDATREIVRAGLVESAHDLSDGGLSVTLAECCFGPANVGASIELDSELRPEFLLFHEGPSRVLVSTSEPDKVIELSARHGAEAVKIGVTREGRLEIRNRGRSLVDCDVAALRKAYECSLEENLHEFHP